MEENTAVEGVGVVTSMVESAEKLSLLLKLIERATSIAVVRDFLKNRNLQHSAASWDELRTKRICPALEDGQLTHADLHALLRSTEGFGRQHIFLFKCPTDRAVAMIAEIRVRKLLQEKGVVLVGGDPLVVDLPMEPTFVDVRFARQNESSYMMLKEVDRHTSRRLTSEVTDSDAMTFTKVYQVENKRAINVARLWDSGLLEIRIASRDNSTRYHDDLAAFFGRLKPIFARNEFREISLKPLKKSLWSKRVELQDLVKFSTYTLQDDEGMSLRANAVLSTDDLAGSERVAKSLAEFNAETVQCSDSNIYFKITHNGDVVKEVHVLLNGEDNEFAVTAAVSEEEYEFVLHQILKHN